MIAGYARSPFQPAGKGLWRGSGPTTWPPRSCARWSSAPASIPRDIEDLMLGCAFPEGEQGLNVGAPRRLARRPAAIASAAPTINRFCGSSMQSVHIAAGADRDRRGRRLHLRRRREHEPRADDAASTRCRNPALAEGLSGAYISMGETAENVADRYGRSPAPSRRPSRSRSQQKAAAAQRRRQARRRDRADRDRGGTVDQDGCIRPDTTPEALAGLKPAFDRTAPSPPAPPRR